MSIETGPRIVRMRPDESIMIIPAEKLTQEGKIPSEIRPGLLHLVVNFGQVLYNSEPGSDSEFGNTDSESRAALPVVKALREAKVNLPQVRDQILDIAEGYSAYGLSNRAQKRTFANRTTYNLKRFADKVLGEPDFE